MKILSVVVFGVALCAGATEYRIERAGGELAAFADGRRFAVLSPAESADWRIEWDCGGTDFIRFTFTPKAGMSGTFRFPEIRLDGDAAAMKAVGSQGFTTLEENTGSAMYLAVAEPKSRKGTVAAWVTSEKGSPYVMSGVSGGAAVLKPELQFGKIGASGSEVFLLGAFDDCRLGLEAYGDAVAAHYSIRLKPQIAGYTTWYDDRYGYSKGFGAGTPASAREFADAVERLGLKEFGFTFFQIDDFWQAGALKNGPAKNFTRTAPDGPFAEGMKPTADYLRAKGLLPGLWYMPFSGTQQDSEWWGDKMGLFVKDSRTGKPYETKWGGTCLDMTNPDAVGYMQDVTRRICREWGYGYIKYDGMWMGMGCKLLGKDSYVPDDYNGQTFADPSETGVGAYRRGMAALREAAGEDTFILACNLRQNIRAMGATYGLVDACRIGGDNGPIDKFPGRYMVGVTNATPRYFLNGRVWYSDPDPVYVRDAVALDRARLFATWTSIGGMLYNFSDWLPDLSAERIDVLKRTMAPHGVKTVRPVDFFERTLANTWVLEKGDARIFGLYNWDEREMLRIDYPAAYAGLDPEKTYVGFDFWRNEFVAPFKGALKAELPPSSCRAIACVPVENHPVLVSTSRHVASPAFEVENVKWEDNESWWRRIVWGRSVLRGESKVVAGDRYELRLYVPAGWRVWGWSPNPEWTQVLSAKGPFVRLAFCPDRTGTVKWHVAFERGEMECGGLDVGFVKGLLAIPSESSSTPGCNRATAYLKGYLEDRGVHCHVRRTEEGRYALYAATNPGKKHDYVFVTHIDVVPAADSSQYEPKVVGDEIWGRGACDTKVNAALIAQVLVNLVGKASVGAFFATDEDGGAGKVPTCTMLRRAGFTPKKMILVGDTLGDSTNRLFVAQKGHWGFRITAKGKGGHSSIPWKLDNAIPKITHAVDQIMAAYPKPPPGSDWHSTLAPTILQAGDAPNTVPGEASATFSFRYIGKNDVKELAELVRKPETLYCVPPVENDPDNPLVRNLFAAMQANWPDREFRMANLYGATDAFQFVDLGLPMVIFSHDGAGAHKPDEHGSLRSAAEYLAFFTKWLQTL